MSATGWIPPVGDVTAGCRLSGKARRLQPPAQAVRICATEPPELSGLSRGAREPPGYLRVTRADLESQSPASPLSKPPQREKSLCQSTSHTV